LGARHSLRPLFSERAKQILQNSGTARREIAMPYPKQRCLKIESAYPRKRVTLSPSGEGMGCLGGDASNSQLDVLHCNARGLRGENMLPASSKTKRLSCPLC
jgi:hypothetical protein